MGIFGGGQSDSQQRFYAASIAEVFAAVVLAADSPGFTLKANDELSSTVVVSTKVSAFTWGEMLNISCLPSEGGTIVQISATGKVGGQIMQSSRSAKMITRFFHRVGEALEWAAKSKDSH